MLGAALIVIVVAQSAGTDTCQDGTCPGDLVASAFRQSAERVLGSEAKLEVDVVSSDPPDEQSAARGVGVDGVVELSFASDGSKARLHCYFSREQRWLDREISFGEARGSARREALERGRLLGFAVASMFSEDARPEPAAPPVEPTAAASAPSVAAGAPTLASGAALSPPRDSAVASASAGRTAAGRTLSLEFAGVASAGLGGDAGGLGASAGLRVAWAGPVWARLFVTGRAGTIPKAQASTLTALMGGGLALALLPETARFELGTRLDAFASYLDASHLSEDDVEADRRSRWLAGGDVVAEGGFRFSQAGGFLAGIGLEGMLGKTEIDTHGKRVALIPPFRMVAELGFRTRF